MKSTSNLILANQGALTKPNSSHFRQMQMKLAYQGPLQDMAPVQQSPQIPSYKECNRVTMSSLFPMEDPSLDFSPDAGKSQNHT
jgi:hypothetical protein